MRKSKHLILSPTDHGILVLTHYRGAVAHLTEEVLQVADVAMAALPGAVESITLEGVVGDEHQAAGARAVAVDLR